MVLVGSKVDKEGDRLVLSAEGQSLAGEFQCDFTEVHARDHFNVKRLFLQVIQPQTAGDQRLSSWIAHSPEIVQKWCEIWRSLYQWCLAGCLNPG
jgi:Ras family